MRRIAANTTWTDIFVRMHYGRRVDSSPGTVAEPGILWFFIALLIMLSVGCVAGIEKEAFDPKIKLLMGIKGRTCAAEGPGASVRLCLGLYPPQPRRV